MTKLPSSAFERGGCSHATGWSRRDVVPTRVRDFDCALHDRRMRSDAGFVTCTIFQLPTGGKSVADASGAAASATPATRTATTIRTLKWYSEKSGGAASFFAAPRVPSPLRGVRADVVERRAVEDRAARSQLPGVPRAVRRDDAVVRRAGAHGADARPGRCAGGSGVPGEDEDRRRERLVIVRLQERSRHALVAAVGRDAVRIGTRRCPDRVVGVVRLDVRQNGTDVRRRGGL